MKQEKMRMFRRFVARENVVGYVFSSPLIIGFFAFTFVPILISLYYSLTDYNLSTTVKPTFIWLENYVRLFQDQRFIKSVRVTLIYVVTSVPAKLLFALLVAYLLTQKRKAVTVYRSLYYVPSLIGGSIAVALVWRELFSKNGLVNHLIESVGFTPISWFGDQRFAMFPLILMSVWQFGSSMIIFSAGLKNIPTTYYEAAYMDGATKRKSFFKITLPCLSPIILYNLVMQTIAAFMSFTQAFVITKGGPNDATNFYSLYVYNQAFKYYDMGYASAMSWVMLLVIGTITWIIFKTSKHWVFSESD